MATFDLYSVFVRETRAVGGVHSHLRELQSLPLYAFRLKSGRNTHSHSPKGRCGADRRPRTHGSLFVFVEVTSIVELIDRLWSTGVLRLVRSIKGLEDKVCVPSAPAMNDDTSGPSRTCRNLRARLSDRPECVVTCLALRVHTVHEQCVRGPLVLRR